jgi:hypothetical protein
MRAYCCRLEEGKGRPAHSEHRLHQKWRPLARKIAAIGCDAVGLDWTIDIGEARRRVGDKVALQGNLDPNVLFAAPEIVAAEAKKVLDSFGQGQYRPRFQPWPRHFAIYATR